MLKFRSSSGALVLSAMALALGAPAATAQTAGWAPGEQVELATGFYARADVSFSRERAPSLGADGSLTFGQKPLHSWAMSVGAGNKFNNWFRADLTFDVRGGARSASTTGPFDCVTDVSGLTRQSDSTNIGWGAVYSQCNAIEQASLRRFSGLANAYIDLGSFGGISPYVGAGLGVTTIKTQGSYDWKMASDGTKYQPTLVQPAGFPIFFVDPVTGVRLDPQPDINFGKQDRMKQIGERVFNATWALMAGVAVDVGSNAKLDVGYRFLNFGKVGTGSTGPASTAHEVRVGVRYMID
ncbi:MAG: porin family protein [Hyphomicrobiales bacterium]|nr:porin family protein [Hyphomicrobiales bacterium]